ncbi:MAG: deoxyribodipyrimidine photo-lyase [Alphaproteobacteria bacterium]
MSDAPAIVWFKRDLRVADHPALASACATGRPVLPLYIIEPEMWAAPDASGRQWGFIRESLVELKTRLEAMGQSLVVRQGAAVDVLESLRQQVGIASLHSHQETGALWSYYRDAEVRHWANSHGIEWREPRQHGVIRRLGTRNGWARRWDAYMSRPCCDQPSALPPASAVDPGTLPDRPDGVADDLCPGRQHGGRDEGLDLLRSFLHQRGQHYRRQMSSPVTAFEACSRLSAHLAWGTLSMREVAQATYARQIELKQANDRSGWRGSLSSFVGRLHWHCHFMQKLEDAPDMELRPLHPAYEWVRPVQADAERLRAWATGQTGWPFMDACMRALQQTGWLNFRMRAMVMAVASYHLWLPWQESGRVLARLFTDYEPGIHWPQVQMQSGVTGTNTLRIYNPVKQGLDQDPDGDFIRHWVPELASLPTDALHQPWKHGEGQSIIAKGAYPAPIVDHMEAARHARETLWALRKSTTHRRKAADVQAQHGSRKSGIKNRGQSRSARAKAGQAAQKAASDQLSLFDDDD